MLFSNICGFFETSRRLRASLFLGKKNLNLKRVSFYRGFGEINKKGWKRSLLEFTLEKLSTKIETFLWTTVNRTIIACLIGSHFVANQHPS